MLQKEGMKLMTKGTYYITTPIYYPSSNLHIGHTYCTVMADAMARFKRLCGYDVRFLTGTDEHGQKIQSAAKENGVTPQVYVDKIVDGIKNLWKTMEISYDDFIRTTEERHKKRVRNIFMKIYENGDIYKGEYEGLYCTPCESFWTENQLVEGNCPDCGRQVEKAKEEAYFFRLSKYADRLIELYENTPFLQPESRRNEMLSFVRQGLEDLCVSRSSFDWGIPVPIDEKHVIYVWLDALSNYITALGFDDEPELYNKYWPVDVHLVGKEIVRFHSVIWPAMLMSMNIPVPKQVLGHGWLLLEGGKMSKSRGNVIDPVKLIDRYGVDALKYFLLREYTFGQDGLFTNEVMLGRMNSDLANDLGNLVMRTVTMIEKYSGGIIPGSKASGEHDDELKAIATGAAVKVEGFMDKFAFNAALEEIWILIRRTNKYIDETMPWVLARDEKLKDRLEGVLHNLAEALRIVSVLIYPFMHTTSKKIREQLGIPGSNLSWEDAFVFDMTCGEKVSRGDAIFPRIDIEKELDSLGGTGAPESIPLDLKPEIDFEDFEKVDFRVGVILECEKHPKADKLLVFKVKMGTEIRQVISGAADDYTPEETIGQKVVVVANLKPRTFRGLESKGMLLFGENGDRWDFVTTTAPDGNGVS